MRAICQTAAQIKHTPAGSRATYTVPICTTSASPHPPLDYYIQHILAPRISWMRRQPNCLDARATLLRSGNLPNAPVAPVKKAAHLVRSGIATVLSYRNKERRLNARDASCKRRARFTGGSARKTQTAGKRRSTSFIINEICIRK